jgi:two-component system chemotaxis sensor kinase CheA
VAARRKTPSRRSKAHREFVSEAEEILERMRDGLSDLADQQTNSGEADPEVINQLFRSAHSLKGLSGMFGFDGLGELAHHLEDVLDRVRLGRAGLDAAALGLLDESVALVALTLEKVESGTQDELLDRVAEVIGRIDAWARSPEPATEAAEVELDPAMLRALTEYEEHRLQENIRRGRRIQVVEASFDILAFEEGLAELTGAVREVGEVLSILPSPGEGAESQIRFSLLVATDIPPGDLEARLEMPGASVREASRAGGAPAVAEPTAVLASDSAVEPSLDPAPELTSLKSISDTVRVDIRKLDELMNLVGELVVQRGALARIARELQALPETARLAAELDKVHKGFERKLQDLQSGVLETRMVPLRQVFEKLSRVVRRLRRDTEKEVRLELRGADTELDKLIVEELVDPLMHIVRNAFDHAIEAPEERRAAGKPAEGCIRLEASQRGNDVVITCSDDGRGIDPAVVHSRAIERGIVSENAPLADREVLDLIFAPGLTTCTEVTETSGRGVGMDVVRANITALGGLVEAQSELERGTTVTMTLPITLAIIQALIVGVADQQFAIPLNSVRETLLVEPDEIQRSEGRELLNLRGDALPLRRLGREFGLGGQDQARTGKQYSVVLGIGDTRVGLLVDRLEGQQDTVIKPIQGPIDSIRGIAGATELGDAGAVLVLDVAALVEDGLRGGGSA